MANDPMTALLASPGTMQMAKPPMVDAGAGLFGVHPQQLHALGFPLPRSDPRMQHPKPTTRSFADFP